MTIGQALAASKEDGRAYTRASGSLWIQYVENWLYEVEADDLMADDWEPLPRSPEK